LHDDLTICYSLVHNCNEERSGQDDGRRENDCRLRDGFIQVLLLNKIFLPDGFEISIDEGTSLDNIVIRGLTFTGNLRTSSPFTGASVLLSIPTSSFQCDDCLWTNMTAPTGLFGVHINGYHFFNNYTVLMLCINESTCSMKDVCIDSFEGVDGLGVVFSWVLCLRLRLAT